MLLCIPGWTDCKPTGGFPFACANLALVNAPQACLRFPETPSGWHTTFTRLVSLEEAASELDKSKWVRGILGDDVVDHYLHFFRTEQRKFNEVVTNWERARYFERA